MSAISAGLIKATNITATDIEATDINTPILLNYNNDININGKFQIGDVTTGWGINQNVDLTDLLNTQVNDIMTDYTYGTSSTPLYFDPSGLKVDFSSVTANIQVSASALNFTPLVKNIGPIIPFSKYTSGDNSGNFIPEIPNNIMMRQDGNVKSTICKGIANGFTQTSMDVDKTIVAWFSMTKTVTAMLFARMCTLGVFQGQNVPIPVSKYFPVLDTIDFYVPKYEDFAAPTVLDSSGKKLSYNVKNTQKCLDSAGVNKKDGAGAFINYLNKCNKIDLSGNILRDLTGNVLSYNVPYESESNFFGSSFSTSNLASYGIPFPANLMFPINPWFAGTPNYAGPGYSQIPPQSPLPDILKIYPACPNKVQNPYYQRTYENYPQQLNIAGKYVNLYLTSRKLYLQDVFEESVNFCGGFLDLYFGNTGIKNLFSKSNLMFGFQAACSDKESPVWDSCGNIGPAFNSHGDKYIFNPTVDFVKANSSVAVPEDIMLERYFANFSGGSYCQLQEHGRYNYNSSEYLGTATLKRAYNQHYGTTLSYFEILQKELLTPVCGPGNSFKYYFDSLADIQSKDLATAWSQGYALNLAGGLMRNGSLDVSINANILTSELNKALDLDILNKPAVWMYFDKTDLSGNAAHDASGNRGQLHLGNIGLMGTVSDFFQLIDLHLYRGCYMDASGVKQRLIDTHEMLSLTSPTEIQEDERYNPLFVSGATVTWNFARGSAVIGGSANSGIPSRYSIASPYSFNNNGWGTNPLMKKVSPNTTLTKNTIYWTGAGGTIFYVDPELGYKSVQVSLDGGGNFNSEQRAKISNVIANYALTLDPDLTTSQPAHNLI